jgi:16S rRNA (adenine1518-N6/adenine1519-N6)-dimethyltransferase
MTAEEIFDVTDEHDNVIGQAPRSEVHARGLLHRAVHVFVLNTAGRLLLQKRSAEKDEFPQYFTSSASGHVSAGETFDECAPRELEEELELRVPIQRLQKFPAGPQTANEHSVLYRAVTDDEPTFDPIEIESGAYFTLDEIATMLDRDPHQFTPPFRILFLWYVEHVGT